MNCNKRIFKTQYGEVFFILLVLLTSIGTLKFYRKNYRFISFRKKKKKVKRLEKLMRLKEKIFKLIFLLFIGNNCH